MFLMGEVPLHSVQNAVQPSDTHRLGHGAMVVVQPFPGPWAICLCPQGLQRDLVTAESVLDTRGILFLFSDRYVQKLVQNPNLYQERVGHTKITRSIRVP